MLCRLEIAACWRIAHTQFTNDGDPANSNSLTVHKCINVFLPRHLKGHFLTETFHCEEPVKTFLLYFGTQGNACELLLVFGGIQDHTNSDL